MTTKIKCDCDWWNDEECVDCRGLDDSGALAVMPKKCFLKELILEVIGEDEILSQDDTNLKEIQKESRNKLRKEQRLRLNKVLPEREG